LRLFLVFYKNCFNFRGLKHLAKYDSNKQYTQAYVDSLLNVLRNSAGKRIELNDFKKILEYNSDFYGWSYYYFGKTVKMYAVNQLDSALYYNKIGIDFYNDVESKRKEANPKDLLMLHYFRGEVYSSKRDYNRAIKNHQIALDISKDNPYKYESVIRQGIASSHYQMDNDSLAYKYYKEVEKDTIYMAVPRGAIVTHTRLGELLERSGNYDDSKKQYEKALDIANSTDYKSGLVAANGGLASLYFKQDRYKQALDFFNNAIQAYENYGAADDASLSDVKFYKAYVKIYKDFDYSGVQEMNELIEELHLVNPKTVNDKNLFFLTIKALNIFYSSNNNAKEYQKMSLKLEI